MIKRILASEIWGAYFVEGLLLLLFYFFWGGEGAYYRNFTVLQKIYFYSAYPIYHVFKNIIPKLLICLGSLKSKGQPRDRGNKQIIAVYRGVLYLQS